MNPLSWTEDQGLTPSARPRASLSENSLVTRDIPALIRALDTGDLREQRRVSRELIAAGRDAVPALTQALSSGAPRIRKAAAYLLGLSARTVEAVRALTRSVIEDPEPKVRQNAAMSLGKTGTPEEVSLLAQALEQEEVGWVRRSLILALGRIEGEAAHAVLGGVVPRDDAEREALRQALDRALPRRQTVTWREGASCF
jgi:HEAT repeat protein